MNRPHWMNDMADKLPSKSHDLKTFHQINQMIISEFELQIWIKFFAAIAKARSLLTASIALAMY